MATFWRNLDSMTAFVGVIRRLLFHYSIQVTRRFVPVLFPRLVRGNPCKEKKDFNIGLFRDLYPTQASFLTGPWKHCGRQGMFFSDMMEHFGGAILLFIVILLVGKRRCFW